jgi:aspartyl-tRNA synthetase
MEGKFIQAFDNYEDLPDRVLVTTRKYARISDEEIEMKYLYTNSHPDVVVIVEPTIIKGINVTGGGSFSRKEIDDLVPVVEAFGAKGLSWAKVSSDGWQSPIQKFLKKEEMKAVNERMGASENDLLLFVAGSSKVVHQALANLRLHLGQKLALIPPDVFQFVWILDFPLLEYDEGEKRFVAVHHPFTAPKDEDLPKLKEHPEDVKAKAYDLVLNGSEVGGGSIRNHLEDVQSLVFEKLGMGKEEARERFGFLLEALGYGTPPHGGIAFGFDRLIMILLIIGFAPSWGVPLLDRCRARRIQSPEPFFRQRSSSATRETSLPVRQRHSGVGPSVLCTFRARRCQPCLGIARQM